MSQFYVFTVHIQVRGCIKLLKGQPGQGAIEFAKFIVQGYERDESLEILQDLYDGYINENINVDIKRIKLCSTCNYFYEDKTRPNNSKTCSKECKIKRDTENRRNKLEKGREKGEIERPRVTRKEKHYYDHYDHPFWVGMEPEEYHKDYEISYDTGKVETIIHA